MNVSQDFFYAIDRVAKNTILADVMIRARRSLLDYLAVTCAGAAFQKQKIEKYFVFAEPEEGALKAIGTGKSLALKEAIFLNGLNAHALDFDDGTNSGIIHLGSPIFSLLIPLAQRYGKSINEMLRAAVIGYEASYTMAVSIQPKHKALGFHATGTCGMLGATLAGAYMLEFTEEERYQAFATACVAASGMLKVLDDGSELKPYNVAKTALLSLTSLQLAKSGFKGHNDPLGGYRGFLKMMSGDAHTEIKPCLLNGTYAIMKSYTKPYASCRYTHPPVEAAIRLRNQYGITPEQVEHIKVETYDLAVSGHDHTDIKGAYSAKMSTPYSVAVALVYGKAGLQEFEKVVLENKIIKELTKKVEVVDDETLSNLFPEKQSAVMTIFTYDGEYVERVDYPKGEPENPLSEEEFRARYEALMSYSGVSEGIFKDIYETVWKEHSTVSELVKNL
ncbi:MAG: MmgE/PrpD family protein [Bacteroidaceae bacterium]|nr:MmgE/PrpD family protein [Bacteroidaceae bacterium]